MPVWKWPLAAIREGIADMVLEAHGMTVTTAHGICVDVLPAGDHAAQRIHREVRPEAPQEDRQKVRGAVKTCGNTR